MYFHLKFLFLTKIVLQDSPLQWASRWDVYLKMRDSQIHWFSIINSIMIVIFLSGMVAMIMMRTLHRDFARYNQIDQAEEAQMEETGWKLVHGDVFRPPKYAGLLASLAGTGSQVFAMAFSTIFFAALGFLTPANRGSIMTGMILLYVFMGIFAGFVGTRLFSMFGLVQWRKNTFLTALLFPGFNFSVFFILNLVVWAKGSSGAVPFFEMFSILVLWFGISVPLVYLGSYLGQQRPPITPPVRVNQIPRQIPPQAWYMKPLFSVLVGGVLPFGAVFIEVFFIMSSIWLHRFYYVFGFLLLVFLILIITCAEITIVMCYFQLCSEDYHWWWRSFFTSGSSAFYMFLYSILYFTTKLDINRFSSALLFFGYMILICFFFFVLTGTIGFMSTLMFVRKIYGSIKVD
jgi:transmembrane 9 superfamily protein 2/4